jgi:hypothetical protein
MSEDMLTWLRDQLDADYKAASAASPGPWAYHPSREFHTPGGDALEFVGRGRLDSADFHGIAATGPAGDPQSMADAGHISRHDPDHVRFDVEAKRKIIDEYGDHGVTRLIAAGYRDRHGYRDEWLS